MVAAHTTPTTPLSTCYNTHHEDAGAAQGGKACKQQSAEARGKVQAELLFALLASNQMAVGWARALYTPFLAWNLYALPIVLSLAGASNKEMALLFFAGPLLFSARWVCCAKC